MFDIGISEIGVIAVVALVVIGPERLPKVARTIGTLLGRAQRYVNDVKAEVNREMELEELRKLQTQMQDAARGIHEQVSSATAEVQTAVHDMGKQLHDGVAPVLAQTDAAAQAAADHLGLTPPAEIPAPASGAPESAAGALPDAPLAHPSPPPAPEPAAAHAASVAAATASGAPSVAHESQATMPASAPDASPAAAHAPAEPPEDKPVQSSLFPEHTIR